MDLSSKGRRSRRGSLDIYTAEYALKIGNQKKITNMQQESSYHVKFENQDEAELLHTVKDFAERRACVDALGWEPFQEWFYDNEFRSVFFLSAIENISI